MALDGDDRDDDPKQRSDNPAEEEDYDPVDDGGQEVAIGEERQQRGKPKPAKRASCEPHQRATKHVAAASDRAFDGRWTARLRQETQAIAIVLRVAFSRQRVDFHAG